MLLRDALAAMAARRTDRLPVVDASGRPAGIIALATSCTDECAGSARQSAAVDGSTVYRAPPRHAGIGPAFLWASRRYSAGFRSRQLLRTVLSHAGIVAAASLAATLVGVALAVFVTRTAGRDFRAMIDALATVDKPFRRRRSWRSPSPSSVRATPHCRRTVPLRHTADTWQCDRGH